VRGATGAGDPFFPHAGNGGYDVGHYGLNLTYSPASRQLVGTATVTARTMVDLCSFDLDLRGFTVSSVTVNGRSAAYARRGQQELVVTPSRPLPRERAFVVVVRYAGQPRTVIDPDGSLDGWIFTRDGVHVASEPQGSPSWYPCNDTPRDKATFDFRVRVPTGTTAVANGELRRRAATAGWTSYDWHEGAPMATYLSTVTIGRFVVTRGRTPRGVPFYDAVDPLELPTARPVLLRLPAIVDYYSSVFGAYPYRTTGAIVDHAPRVGYALETQTRPLFDRTPSEGTLAHELAHQWFGDSVTLRTWPQIWLHEGFAEWSAWLWSEHRGGRTAQQFFARLYATPASNADVWLPPPGRPGKPANLFAGSVYDRGAMTLQALRVKIGDGAFFVLLRSWVAQHRHGNASIAQFRALAERISGRDLGDFFRVWLYRLGKPLTW
jgi:aminopeptidase N